ncbi:MAG: hypothetical protein P0Y66_02675 [Candidatus Kaistia colombiensis]|nr:MAG: hypothetical protein P0Y66_02675 [Kaistia sp.]
MPRRIGSALAIVTLAGLVIPGARAEAAKPPQTPPDAPSRAECRKIGRCIPTRDELDGKATRDGRIKTRHDTAKPSISNVR